MDDAVLEDQVCGHSARDYRPEEAALHASRDGHDLAAEMPGGRLRRQEHDRRRAILGRGHLAQRVGARGAVEERAVEQVADHRRHRPAGRDHVDAAARRESHDLVLEAAGQAEADARLDGGVLRVALLAEDARRRADHHDRPLADLADVAQVGAAGEERRRQVAVHDVAEAVHRHVDDRHRVARPDARVRDAHVEPAERGDGGRDQRVGRRLVGEVGLQRDAAGLRREPLGLGAARPVVDRDPRALGREGPYRRRTDAARAAGHEDALARQSQIHGVEHMLESVRYAPPHRGSPGPAFA